MNDTSPSPEHLGDPPDVGTAVAPGPTLAPNVHLLGEMQGTSFAARQWLVERNGTFVQLTELLYRIVERADGTRTVSDIAASVTEATEWIVTDGQVGHLVETKLTPLGLIAGAARPDTSGAGAGAGRRLR